MALSCFLPQPATVAAEANAVNREIPIFMAHGTEDAVIPLARARMSRDVLTKIGYAVEWREYRMAHSVSPEEIRDLSAWLARVLT